MIRLVRGEDRLMLDKNWPRRFTGTRDERQPPVNLGDRAGVYRDADAVALRRVIATSAFCSNVSPGDRSGKHDPQAGADARRAIVVMPAARSR
jgi:hypothetical protein